MKPYRSKKYREWIKALPCCVTGNQADDPHHISGFGLSGMGMTPSDYFAIPLCRRLHTDLHSQGIDRWHDLYGSQAYFLADTLQLAIDSEKVDLERLEAEVRGIRHSDLRELLIRRLCFD